MKETDIREYGLYIIRDGYFQTFPYCNMMWNKDESRPTYFALKDRDGILWMIPLSSNVQKYKEKAEAFSRSHKGAKCIYYEFAKIASKESVFLIGNMFPVSHAHILRPYTIMETAYIVKDTNAIKRIHKKAAKYLNLLERGTLQGSANVLQIKKQLIDDASMAVKL